MQRRKQHPTDDVKEARRARAGFQMLRGGRATVIERCQQKPFQVQPARVDRVLDGRTRQPPDFMACILQPDSEIQSLAIAGDVAAMPQISVKPANFQGG